MGKDSFSVAGAASLSDIPPAGRIHVIGVCGVAMAQLAIALSERRFVVSGSDKEFYEPMSSLLEKSAVQIYRGYTAENVPSDVDLVIIGNAVSYGHPEVAVVEERQLRYSCFPKILYELVIRGKHSAVVTGTHGKTTTTALFASVLYRLGEDPGYFIGGVASDLPKSLSCGEGKFSVVEGDEYDSAFFAKVPKFSFYRPDLLVINAIEYDHADIYNSLDEIIAEFDKLIASLGSSALVLCCVDCSIIAKRVRSWRRSSPCRFETFGVAAEADWRIAKVAQLGRNQQILFTGPRGAGQECAIQLPGMHNAKNALAVYLSCCSLGLDRNAVVEKIGAFSGVKRRQEIRFEQRGITIIEDFAHHPTAVRETISAIRSAFPGKALIAVFEPRSNTSRLKVFQEEYIGAFAGADSAILAEVAGKSIDGDRPLLDVSELAREVNSSGVRAVALRSVEEIENRLCREVGENSVVLIMSNGSFGGLIDRLVKRFENRSTTSPVDPCRN